MTEWWSYRPQDFLMFTPHTYWRLIELQTDAWWPLPVWCAIAGLAGTVWLGLRPRRGKHRLAFRLAAATWGFAGWALVWLRYAPINSVASGFAVGFGVQALLLGGLATFANCPDEQPCGSTRLAWADR